LNSGGKNAENERLKSENADKDAKIADAGADCGI